jgi:heme-degrading monooxygenase HmoA
MIVNLFRVTVPPEHVAGFEKSWTMRSGKVDHMPGFQGLEVLRDSQRPGVYIILTRWDSREHFDAWRQSPEFFAAHAGPSSSEDSAESGALDFYEIVPSTPVAH